MEVNQAEIIPGRLYWVCAEKAPPTSPTNQYIEIRDHERPMLNLSELLEYLNSLDQHFFQLRKEKLSYFSKTDEESLKRSVYLMGAYQIIRCSRTVDASWKPFSKLETTILAKCKLEILDYLYTLEFGLQSKWIQQISFLHPRYNMDWAYPKRILLLNTPSLAQRKKMVDEGITTIIRLNKSCYPTSSFFEQKIKVYDLLCDDGLYPSDQVIKEFFLICQRVFNSEKDRIAIHCQPGSGLAGTLTCCYLMVVHELSATAAASWVRFCRQESAPSKEQNIFLIKKEKEIKIIWDIFSQTFSNQKKQKVLRLPTIVDQDDSLSSSKEHSFSVDVKIPCETPVGKVPVFSIRQKP